MSSPAPKEQEGVDVVMGDGDDRVDSHGRARVSTAASENGSGDDGDDKVDGHDGARVSAAAAENGSGDGDVEGKRSPTACCICKEPWACMGAHRICCIPCGHVYGRSCLERWLRRCGNTRAKCPQCRQRFKLKHITNLYAPGYLWDGGCRIQEVEAYFYSKMSDVTSQVESLVARQSEQGKEIAQLRSRLDALDGMLETHKKQAAQKFVSVKEQMKKMVEAENATPMDLIQLMEQTCCKLRADLIRLAHASSNRWMDGCC